MEQADRGNVSEKPPIRDGSKQPGGRGPHRLERFVGIDVGAETIKLVELTRSADGLAVSRRQLVEHGKRPGPVLKELIAAWDWPGVAGAAVTGRLSRQVSLQRVPVKQAQSAAYHHRFGSQPATVVSIGSRGFSVLELRRNAQEVFRENSRCSQGTGNFLRQLLERFGLSIEVAGELAMEAGEATPLSARCPVILKTDMTHLANKGEPPARILAGLFDAVCENATALLKPGRSPARVVLIGGVSRSRRVDQSLRKALAVQGFSLAPALGEDALYFEALGCALIAAESPGSVPALEDLLAPAVAARLEKLPPLVDYLPMVRRMSAPKPDQTAIAGDLILGFDIGSTGSKLVALEAGSRQVAWQGYVRTAGNPVGAAQELAHQFAGQQSGVARVRALGVTGSGREIVGSLMATCYGSAAVFVLNEIAAHAAGAVHYEPRVDTIFEIGGQDAKYIRLAGGRVVDCAMNEACSAGTGSFIEEQGGKFSGIENLAQLNREALEAESGVSLGQHCSVFMAEIIDEAVAARVDRKAIIAGLYDSIVQNYLNRVKGNRTVGRMIFCQGMPFSADALAAAVARQLRVPVVVPPHPGTVGALGIALLAGAELAWRQNPALDLQPFLDARIEEKETFVCGSTKGCGGGGNRCRIESIRTAVNGQRQRFCWGGSCSLYDQGARKKKLPEGAPDPFREREALLEKFHSGPAPAAGDRLVAISDQFILKELFPFFATFLRTLGLRLTVPKAATQATLKAGIRKANVPCCAPLQMWHGVSAEMSATDCDFLFLPMVCELPRVDGEKLAKTCPVVQASSAILGRNLGLNGKVLQPLITVGARNLESEEFLASCARVGEGLGVRDKSLLARAHAAGLEAQRRFERECLEIGRRALRFCEEHSLPAVVVVARPYTLYSRVLNSNVPALLREQGAMAIPLDCYPVASTVPVFHDMYWGYGQRILRAAHQIRRSPGVYAVYCSNYSCGPDSFNLHFFGYVMEGKPFVVIETDGHSGDAGTRTRLEAFLYCAEQDRRATCRDAVANDFSRLKFQSIGWGDIRPADTVIVPRLGQSSEVVSSCLRGLGFKAETLPAPDADAVRMGRRYTSGRECLPMSLTLGSTLRRIEQDRSNVEEFVLLMPGGTGPCRYGVYHLLNRIVFDRVGLERRLRLLAPSEEAYFQGAPKHLAILLIAGFTACDLLQEALLMVRPVELAPGATQALYDRYWAQLLTLLQEAGTRYNLPQALWEVATGRLFGVSRLLHDFGRELALLRGDKEIPTVLLAGEIYTRCNPFANDHLIEGLEQRGLRVLLASSGEWLDYTAHLEARHRPSRNLSDWLSAAVRKRVARMPRGQEARWLGLFPRSAIADVLKAGAQYVPEALEGESILTVGLSVERWQRRQVDAIINAGPLECMPSKIAEAQLQHFSEHEGVPVLTLALNGDPVDPEVLNNFAFEVHARRNRARRFQPAASPLAL